MWLTLQYHSFLSVQKTGITFKRTAHTICLCTLLMQCFRKYVTLHTQDLDIITLRFRLILYKYLQVPPAQSNNNKLVSVSGPRPRRES